MPDKLSEVAKNLGLTKRNTEAALRRYQVSHPKIERVRDIFDDIIPFEMEFETDQNDTLFNMDLYFNKPPPLRSCPGRFTIPCAEFIEGPGDHLIQVTARYKPGSVVVFRNGIKLDSSGYGEYDPINGLVFVIGTSSLQNVFNICYVVDNAVPCPPTFIATGFFGVFSFTVGTFMSDYDLNPNFDDLVIQYGEDFDSNDVFNYGAFSTISSVAQISPQSQATITELVPILPDTFIFPSAGNIRMSWTAAISGTTGTADRTSHVGWIGFGMQWRFKLFDSPNGPGFYVEHNGSGLIKVSSALSGIITIDNNTERGTLIFDGPGIHFEEAAYEGVTISPLVSHSFQMFGTLGAGEIYASASLTDFEIGCSLEYP